ncbi:MAG TPA: alpha/beta hydrolase, partial [Roseiarcus sp.]|nr:alpha/beta hydrolase [Roseiarcus sp.]
MTTLDRAARRFLDLARASAAQSAGQPSPDDMRRATEALAAFAASERRRDVATRDASLRGPAADLPIRIYAPRAAQATILPGLVYFHGGGWISGSLDSHDGICRALADEGACRVIAVAYRLAPEHPFPAALEDGARAVETIAAEAESFAIDPRRIGVAGDSAGGNLAAALCGALRGGPPIALQLLLCPVLDALGRTPSRRALASGYFLEERTMARYFEHYRIAGLAPDDPRVSPLRAADFGGLPPTRIHAAEYDPLRDEAALYAERLAEAGVGVRLTVHQGMIHHFYGLGDVIPYAAAALKAIGAEIR